MSEEKKEEVLNIESFDQVPNDYTGDVVMEKRDWIGWDGCDHTIETAHFINGLREGATVIDYERLSYDVGKAKNPKPLDTHTEIPFKQGKIEGIAKTYLKDGGELIEETPYVNNEKHGISKKYSPYSFGKIISIEPYSHGELDGIVIEDDLRGKKSYTQYKNGKKNGIEEKYESGVLCTEITYADGKKVSVKDYEKGTITYNDGRVAKISEEEMKNPVGTLEKIASAKNRLHKHFENPKENAQKTDKIRDSIAKSTPIRNVAADAPFKVVPTKRGGMGE